MLLFAFLGFNTTVNTLLFSPLEPSMILVVSGELIKLSIFSSNESISYSLNHFAMPCKSIENNWKKSSPLTFGRYTSISLFGLGKTNSIDLFSLFDAVMQLEYYLRYK